MVSYPHPHFVVGVALLAGGNRCHRVYDVNFEEVGRDCVRIVECLFFHIQPSGRVRCVIRFRHHGGGALYDLGCCCLECSQQQQRQPRFLSSEGRRCERSPTSTTTLHTTDDSAGATGQLVFVGHSNSLVTVWRDGASEISLLRQSADPPVFCLLHCVPYGWHELGGRLEQRDKFLPTGHTVAYLR